MQTSKVTEVILLPVAKFDEQRFKEGCRLILKMISHSEEVKERRSRRNDQRNDQTGA